MTKSNAELEADIARSLHRAAGQSGFVGFATWADVLSAARGGERLWYHAPLDRSPRSIAIRRVFKNGKIRVDPLSNQADDFSADAGHLDRFYRRA